MQFLEAILLGKRAGQKEMKKWEGRGHTQEMASVRALLSHLCSQKACLYDQASMSPVRAQASRSQRPHHTVGRKQEQRIRGD